MLNVKFCLVCDRPLTSKKTQLEFEMPPIELAFHTSIHDISIPEIVSLQLHTSIDN